MNDKFSSTQNITQMITDMFDTAGENIEPIMVDSDRCASREAAALVMKFDSASDWDEQLIAIQRGMSLVKGGACGYPGFISVIPSLVPGISSGVLNLRSTLVKYCCLFVTQMAKVMKEKFETTACALIPILFQPTTHGTQIIASSCRHSIQAITTHCVSRKVMSAIIQNVASKGQVHRNIVAQCIEIMTRKWKKTFLSTHFKVFERVIASLSQDAGIEARNHARTAAKTMMGKFPERKLAMKTDVPVTPRSRPVKATREVNQTRRSEQVLVEVDVETSVETEKSEPMIGLELSKDIAYVTTSRESFGESYECKNGEEWKFIDNVRLASTVHNEDRIRRNADAVAAGFMKCLTTPIESVLMQALNVIVDVIPVITKSFDKHLDELISTLLNKAENVKSVSLNASSVLRTISAHYPVEHVLLIGLKSPPSCPLLSFAANVVRRDETVLAVDAIAMGLLPVCCSIYDSTKEQRFSGLAVGLLNKINDENGRAFQDFASSVESSWQEILRSLHLMEPEQPTAVRRPIRVLQKQKELPNSLQRVISREKYKSEALVELARDARMHVNDRSVRVWLESLSPLMRTEYCDEVQRCINAFIEYIPVDVLVESAVENLRSDGMGASADILRLIVQRSQPRDLAPRIHVISASLKTLLESGNVRDRKSAVFCAAELRLVLGSKFELQIEKLPVHSQHVIHSYVERQSTPYR